MLWKKTLWELCTQQFPASEQDQVPAGKRKSQLCLTVSQGACFPSGFCKLFHLFHKEGSGLKLRHAENRKTPVQFPEERLCTEVLSWIIAEVSNKTVIPASWKDIYFLPGQQQMPNYSTRTIPLTWSREASTGPFVLALFQN